ncbi:hypothetical protein G7Z17_g3561 [Cylindrodendrum hubeiense]|uniref:Major facilitator superfamily (MFS) profile domain-containing protein n=1 Tax=Cylindrodendrum hubeiense TaxID=595255 RepID=A0A9P5LI22_9HYPO|nr:hypothetical protein G7Z17_g3561 [Cylindrodendrum hubeiense]
MEQTTAKESVPNSDSADTVHSPDTDHSPEPPQTITNLQLSVVISGLWLSLFLCSLETTIVSTSLIHISNDLDDLNQASWIVVAYLLTFNAFILIWSKLSDTFGTKWLLLSANFIFFVFSIACAVSKTMVQLIIFRAFQGIGGSGMYSLVFVVMAQIVPLDKLGICTGILSSVAPGIAVVFAILGKFMTNPKSKKEVQASMKTMDLVGAFLSLAWAIPLIFALQEGGDRYEWNSGVIIGTLVTGVVMLILFALWEGWVYRHSSIDGIFPVRLLKRSVTVLIFLSLLWLGFTFYVPVIQIPQRFQHVNNTTATRAGILVLPLTLVSPCSALCSGILVGKNRHWAPALAILGGCLNVIGITLISTLPIDSDISHAQYGYQVLIGLSLGLLTPSLMYLIKIQVDEKDIAGAMGVGNMGRTLGGCIGLAIGGSLLHTELDKDLPKFLSEEQIEALAVSSSLARSMLTEEQQIRVGEVYGRGFNMQFKALIAFAGLSLITAILLYFAHIRSMNEKDLNEVEHREDSNERDSD